MSCFDGIKDFSEELDPNKKDSILDSALECYQNEEERRDKELKDFIDDFVASEEYAEYIRAKRDIMKRCKGTQYDVNDVLVELRKRETVEKYPLTEEQKKMWAFKKKFEKFAERQRIESEVKKQEKSIQMIRSKINEARRIFECTNEQIKRKKRNHEEYLLEKYTAKFNISANTFLSATGQTHLLERFKFYHQTLHNRNKKRQENTKKIIEKIVREYRLNKDIAAKEKKHLEYQPRNMERIIKDMDVVGTKIDLIDRAALIQLPESEPEPIKEPEVVPEKSSKKKKSAKSEKNKKEKHVKKEKKESKKKLPKEKKTHDKKAHVQDKLELPIIPVVNPRQKILPQNIDNILDIIEEFREFDSRMEDTDILRRQHKYILGDGGVSSKPDSITFHNFDEGKTYKKTIALTNISTQTRKIRFEKFVFFNEYDEVVFGVENFGIQKLLIGCKVKFYLTFQPYDSTKCYEGKIVFLSYDNYKCQYYQFEVGIRCIPKYSDLKIVPEGVSFGAIPMWRSVDREHFKVIKLQNKGTKPCTIYIRKNFDPLGIEHLLDEENKENVVPLDADAESSTSYQEVSTIFEDCLRNIENNFQFESGFFSLGIGEEKKLKISFKNASYIGNYFEEYTLEVYEAFLNGALETVGCKVMIIEAETTGHFLTTSPEVLDFGTCVINSSYQIMVEVINNSTVSQAVAIRVPAGLGDTMRSSPAMIYLSPRNKRAVFLKFNPKDVIFRESQCQFYDKNCSILEFCIQICPVSKVAQDYPPVEVPVYAVIANYEDLSISFHTGSKHMTNFLNTLLIDMGECSVYEQIWAEISLTNNTSVTQICGFMDLPQMVTLEPHYGFCKLYPGQRKKFKLYFRPEIRDFPSYTVGSLRNSNYFFKLRVENICSMGEIIKDVNSHRRESTRKLTKQLTMMSDAEILSSMGYDTADLHEHCRTESIQVIQGDSRINSILAGETQNTYRSPMHDKSVDTLLNYQNFVIVETDSRREMWIKTNLKRPLVEFSHQIVEFPDTPCGSYSVMEISLHALDREMDKYCSMRKSPLDYIVQYQIIGESKEIFVEPSCGILEAGQSVKIALLARPMVPQDIVEQTAKKIKYSEIYEMKLKEYQALGEKKSKKGVKGKKSAKKSKENKNKPKSKKKTEATTKKDEKQDLDVPNDQPNIVVTDKEVECDYLDYYPAEMVYWRNLKPYYISANFTCLLNYEQKTVKMHKRTDKIFLEALCKVTRPDFSINLNLQRIDFGTCLVGSTARKNIMVQNITYQNIQPQMSLLNPLGFFSIPYIRDITVPPEHTLILPVQFKPTSAKNVTEYVELKSNATAIPLILCGEGCEAAVKITPEFEILRVETKANKLAELQLKIDNQSKAEATISFKKLFEIEAAMADIVQLENQKEVLRKGIEEQNEKDKKAEKSKDKKKKKEKKHAKEKGSKHSDNLTDIEIEAVSVCFEKVQGDSHFEFKSSEPVVRLLPYSFSHITLLCGEPEQLKRKGERAKKGKKENKKEPVESDTKTRSTKKTLAAASEIAKVCEDKQYIVQYNVWVGNVYFRKLIVICTIKY